MTSMHAARCFRTDGLGDAIAESASLYGLEVQLLRHTSLPFGLSVLLIARRP